MQRQLFGQCSGAVHRRFSRPCDHAATFCSVGSAPDSVIAGDSGHSSCATEKGTRLSALLFMVAVVGFFDAFCVIFRALPVVPELSAIFSSFRALTTVSARGLQWV